MEEPTNRENTGNRNPDGTFMKGVSGNPTGRPKNTMKDYIARKFNNMSDEEKELWLTENKISGIDMWKMGEGNPKQDTDVTSGGEVMQGVVILPKKDDSTLATTA